MCFAQMRCISSRMQCTALVKVNKVIEGTVCHYTDRAAFRAHKIERTLCLSEAPIWVCVRRLQTYLWWARWLLRKSVRSLCPALEHGFIYVSELIYKVFFLNHKLVQDLFRSPYQLDNTFRATNHHCAIIDILNMVKKLVKQKINIC